MTESPGRDGCLGNDLAVPSELRERIELVRQAEPKFGPLLDEILDQVHHSPYLDGRPACYLVPHLEALADVGRRGCNWAIRNPTHLPPGASVVPADREVGPDGIG